MNTLSASTVEGYTDCPWRERGSYIGDSWVTANLHRLVSSDLSIGERTFRVFGQGRLPNGQIPSCVPSWIQRPHEDFSYVWLLGVRDLWALTGDIEIILQNWPAIEDLWKTDWDTHESGLWNANKNTMFLDWGVDHEDRKGDANAAINILRVAGLEACAEMAQVCAKG